jgi:AcrR family transcriptional regulator
VKITAPSLYAAFGDKERLYLEAVERYKSDLGNSGRILAGEATARGPSSGFSKARRSS